MKLSFILNGRDVEKEVDPAARLVDVLREEFGITSFHPSCYEGHCGNCALLMGGTLVYSCILPAFAAMNASVHTYEGIIRSTEYSDIEAGFEEAGYSPCPFCLPSKTVITQSILESSLEPLRHTILDAFSGSYCPCTNLDGLVEAIQAASRHRRRRLNVL
jgi:aerobic-type carbon monoxide dehydrogenase small subunit (CoxS/CutS family)